MIHPLSESLKIICLENLGKVALTNNQIAGPSTSEK
jgi:hypothetical protein